MNAARSWRGAVRRVDGRLQPLYIAAHERIVSIQVFAPGRCREPPPPPAPPRGGAPSRSRLAQHAIKRSSRRQSAALPRHFSPNNLASDSARRALKRKVNDDVRER